MQLTSQILINAYSQGVFPMADEGGAIYWYDPDPRAILPLESFHVPRRLARAIRRGKFDLRVDTAFEAVIRACSHAAPGRERTWINQEIIDVYTALHRRGFAHSVESWRAGKLVGGLYGVSLRGLFAGESMFSLERDASKAALVHLVERLTQGGFILLDTQFSTPHLQQFGAIEISRQEYKLRLAYAMEVSGQWESAFS
ncbi:MAG TPA: leucyl/phenylalanyl-tRNA--protein transferase [Chloroflexi bacterium]|nr:leucyl/phenylalanyl-tRNA--protein transferase [Chloroflexota bacterium]